MCLDVFRCVLLLLLLIYVYLSHIHTSTNLITSKHIYTHIQHKGFYSDNHRHGRGTMYYGNMEGELVITHLHLHITIIHSTTTMSMIIRIKSLMLCV